eukprot:g34484.t1
MSDKSFGLVASGLLTDAEQGIVVEVHAQLRQSSHVGRLGPDAAETSGQTGRAPISTRFGQYTETARTSMSPGLTSFSTHLRPACFPRPANFRIYLRTAATVTLFLPPSPSPRRSSNLKPFKEEATIFCQLSAKVAHPRFAAAASVSRTAELRLSHPIRHLQNPKTEQIHLTGCQTLLTCCRARQASSRRAAQYTTPGLALPAPSLPTVPLRSHLCEVSYENCVADSEGP